MTIANNIMELRKQKGISQDQLAEMSGFTKSTIVKWEANEVIPSIEELKLLSDIFQVPVDNIINASLYENCHQNQTKKWNCVCVCIYSIMLWISGIVLLIVNRYFSWIPDFGKELSNFSPEINILAFVFMLLSIVLFIFNLFKNRK